MRILLLSLSLHVACSAPSYGRLLMPEPHSLLNQGQILFEKDKYESAQHQLEAYIRLQGNDLSGQEAHYYAALCAIKLGRPDGEERLRQFIKDHPQSHKRAPAHYQLGNLFAAQENFVEAIGHYLQVDQAALNAPTRYALQYHLAYAYLNEKDFEQALAYFNDIKAHESAYRYAASYYSGYIAFKNEAYATALEDLMRASESEAYQPVVPYLAVQVYYKQKGFQELIDYITAVRSTAVVLKNEDEITLLTAEAYFFMGNYVEAARNYEEYIAFKDFAATDELLYRAACALYKAGEAFKALKHFKELALQEDAIGQSASYHAGLLYLKENEKPLALAAFDKARKADFSPTTQEEAAFQYGKVSYDLGYFSATIATFQQLKQTHGASKHIGEVDALLSEAYLRTKDYGLAIAHIEGLATKTQRILTAYQKVTFCQGGACFNSEDYDQAICLLQKSLNHPFDKGMATQTQLWLGESFSALHRYAQAITAYQHVLSSSPKTEAYYLQALYGLAYAYFYTENYGQALPQFVHYTTQKQGKSAPLWRGDALLRLADCYYATKDYQQALKVYTQAHHHHPAHVHYQKGIIYGILNDIAKARASFQVIFDAFEDTPYYERALFEVGHLDFVQNNYPQAIERFTKFIKERPQSLLVPDALLARAIAYANLEQYAQAAQDYGTILNEYPSRPSAQSALLELPKLYAREGKPEKFAPYLANYRAANPESNALERVAFDTAKALFYDQRYAAAIEGLKEFLHHHPQSGWAPEAVFLIAEAYYRAGDVANAMLQYKAALGGGQADFHNKILLRMGALAYKQRDFAEAVTHYSQLQDCAKNKKETYYAREGMMKASHALKRYEAVRKYAGQIIKEGNIAVSATSEATLFLGKAAMQQGELQEAQDYFAQVVASGQDSHAAEAQYLLGQLHYERKAYQKSLETLFALNKQFPTCKVWVNKAFLLVAENYLVLGESLQAQATLQSIIDNAEDEETVASAAQKLEALLAQRAMVADELPAAEGEAENKEFKTLED